MPTEKRKANGCNDLLPSDRNIWPVFAAVSLAVNGDEMAFFLGEFWLGRGSLAISLVSKLVGAFSKVRQGKKMRLEIEKMRRP